MLEGCDVTSLEEVELNESTEDVDETKLVEGAADDVLDEEPPGSVAFE